MLTCNDWMQYVTEDEGESEPGAWEGQGRRKVSMSMTPHMRERANVCRNYSYLIVCFQI